VRFRTDRNGIHVYNARSPSFRHAWASVAEKRALPFRSPCPQQSQIGFKRNRGAVTRGGQNGVLFLRTGSNPECHSPPELNFDELHTTLPPVRPFPFTTPGCRPIESAPCVLLKFPFLVFLPELILSGEILAAHFTIPCRAGPLQTSVAGALIASLFDSVFFRPRPHVRLPPSCYAR
jgi:hypothetical protein